ncbi:hypothetical protein N8I77_009138 [Diaporthe amygdali]|uniref:MYND-type domain-containing protein n=1 Tax=Phomopsis amygdali TaxID=1214568 RepID=A0AAD9S903_PHOAM|nr:hypothetical protein N8I77_009138 [Diaporthe amygdali]
MGRWGHCLFGHDDAIGHAIKISKDVAQGDDRQFAHMMSRVIVGCPPGVFGFYVEEYSLAEKIGPGEMEASMDQLIQHKLDSGLGNELFEKYRAAEQHGFDFDDMSKYLVIVFAVVLMGYGAKIKESQIQHLRDLVPKLQCNEGVVPPFGDSGFRGPGKRQFLAALDHYQAGKRRSFTQPSCHGCGKVNGDIKAEGKTLMKCGGCKNERAAAWFCDKDCQKGLWKHHKHNCGAPLGRGIALFRSFGKASFGVIAYDGANV